MIPGIDEKLRRLAALEEERARLVSELGSAGYWSNSRTDAADRGAGWDSTAHPRLGHAWTLILTELISYRHFRANDVMRISLTLMKEGRILRDQSHASARAQLSHLTKKGVVNRLGGGNYRVSEGSKKYLRS